MEVAWKPATISAATNDYFDIDAILNRKSTEDTSFFLHRLPGAYDAPPGHPRSVVVVAQIFRGVGAAKETRERALLRASPRSLGTPRVSGDRHRGFKRCVILSSYLRNYMRTCVAEIVMVMRLLESGSTTLPAARAAEPISEIYMPRACRDLPPDEIQTSRFPSFRVVLGRVAQALCGRPSH